VWSERRRAAGFAAAVRDHRVARELGGVLLAHGLLKILVYTLPRR